MNRGDVVLVVAPGDYEKPRPAVVVQSDLFNETHANIVVCLLSSDLQDAPLFRLTIEPTRENGLQAPSQVMVDKIVALKRDRIRARIGSLGKDMILSLNRSLTLFLGLV